jgi:ketosteroid isomerase-like protein
MLKHRWYHHVLPLAALASLAIPAIAAGQGIQPHIPLSTTLGDIAKLRVAYVSAINGRNPGAASAMYTADAIVLGADGRQTIGAPAIAKLHSDSAAGWARSDIHSTSVKVFGATAVDVGTWAVRTPAGGETMRRYLAVLRHGVNGWKLQSVAIVPATQ